MGFAPREHMQKAFTQRRNQIIGDCFQLKVDVDVYNDLNQDQPAIQLVLDFSDGRFRTRVLGRRGLALFPTGSSGTLRSLIVPCRPPLTRLGAFPRGSSISPVAILGTMIAAPITSAGRFSPRGLGAWRFQFDQTEKRFLAYMSGLRTSSASKRAGSSSALLTTAARQ